MSQKTVNVRIRNTEQYIRVLNGIFRLTDKEIIVLARFIDKQKEFNQKDIDIDIFSAEVKKTIAEELGMEDFNTLNVYIKRLKDKNALAYSNKYKINPILIKKEDEEGILFRWQEKMN